MDKVGDRVRAMNEVYELDGWAFIYIQVARFRGWLFRWLVRVVDASIVDVYFCTSVAPMCNPPATPTKPNQPGESSATTIATSLSCLPPL